MRLYKYITAELFETYFDSYKEGKLFFSAWDKLNDPTEGFFRSMPSINEQVKEALRREKKNYKVCSLAKDSDNFLLWSHYADSHRGICLGFEISENILNGPDYYHTEINYKDELFLLNLISKCIDFKEQAHSILTTKLDQWGYEDEYRLLKQMDRPGLVKIGTLAEVILGCNNPYTKIFNLFGRNDLVKKAKIDKKMGKIEIVDCAGQSTDHTGIKQVKGGTTNA